MVSHIPKAKAREICKQLVESGLPLDFKDPNDAAFMDNRAAFAKICRPDLHEKIVVKEELEKQEEAAVEVSNPKLKLLLEIEGLTYTQLCQLSVYDSVIPGICMNPGCDYTTGVEPDQSHGWCEVCETQTVKSGAMLVGII